jgi:capsular polysaccharide export protein
MNYSPSRKLIKSIKNFLNIIYYSFADNLLQKKGLFYGWGRKKSGQKAVALAKKYNTPFVLLEDGFIRSIGLGVDGSPSFSLVEDDVGIYYDATSPSKLENLLNSYDFVADTQLMADAKRAMAYMVEHNISKYNSAAFVDNQVVEKYELNVVQKRVLLIAQTAGDSSLEYGMLTAFSTDDMLNAAIGENPDAKIYLKIHPDVLSDKKKSDIDIVEAKKHCTIIEEDLNPLSLLKYFDKVYTKTSGMGFEALLAGCECVCFGMPFYAGWGVTTDKSVCTRRQAKRSVAEIFATAYILYTRYYNPYEKRDCDIFEVMREIVDKKSFRFYS